MDEQANVIKQKAVPKYGTAFYDKFMSAKEQRDYTIMFMNKKSIV